MSAHQRKLLGTFQGVFTPTLLTILGVIMYLRLGWVIGNAGLLGGWLVMATAIAITSATGLSLSSISTNTRLGVGGPYALIARSVGVEFGGSIGIPLFLSQALAVGMYIFGFREGWIWLFPSHPALAVDLVVFSMVLAIAIVSADFAFRVQYGILALIAGTVVLILASPAGWTELSVPIWGSFSTATDESTSFWGVFAVFFPAVTGITAGANMSGDLEDPRHSIAAGTMSAIVVSTGVYFAMALWLAHAGAPEQLTTNYTFLMDHTLWGLPIAIGLLGATFSSALTSLIGAPRILQALIQDGVLPRASWLATPSADGEPRRAMFATAGVVLGGLLLRDLNLIAPLITLFFLITYMVINLVVLAESSLGLQSYRPTWAIPRFVPLAGAIGCGFAMVVIHPTFSLIAGAIVLSLYRVNLHRGLVGIADSRTGIFGAIAEWAAARATFLEQDTSRAWKPHLLVPVPDPEQARRVEDLLCDLALPEGSIKLLGIADQESMETVSAQVSHLAHELRRREVFATWSAIDSRNIRTGLIAGLQALRSAYFRPNILFISLPDTLVDRGDGSDLEYFWRECDRLDVGMALYAPHPTLHNRDPSVVHLWIELPDFEAPLARILDEANLHLALLMGLRLASRWGAELTVYATCTGSPVPAEHFLAELFDRARFPPEIRREVRFGELESVMAQVPRSDLDILPLPQEPDIARVRRVVEISGSAALFFSNSGKESVLA